jgi:hypothetical protein
MEQLKQDARRLAVWNLAVSVAFFIIMAIFFSGKNPRIAQADMLSFTGWNCFVEVIMLPLLFYLWFRFFKGLKNAYPDNNDIKYAARIGTIAYIMISVAFAAAWIAAILDAYIITPDRFGCNINAYGIIPNNAVGQRCDVIQGAAKWMICLMYYILFKLSEPKSTMRRLTLILALRSPFMILVSLVVKMTFNVIFLDVIFWIVEFIFLWQISKADCANFFVTSRSETEDASR